MNECLYCDFDREAELHNIELYEGCDKTGAKYYYLDIHRPTGFIPEEWRTRILYIRYCPMCGKKLLDD